VVAAVVAAVTVAERAELGLALRPVDLRLAFGNAAGGAHAFLVEGDGRLLRVAGVPVLAVGDRLLVAVGAAGAEDDLGRQPVEPARLGDVGRVVGEVYGLGIAKDVYGDCSLGWTGPGSSGR